ncbi:MAG: hypothetical protein WC565_03550 [Parcubacteria group bacterium]
MDPKTVAWSRETIVRGGLGGFQADKMAQAKAILERLRKERPYIEDPIDGEFIPSAACTLEGCDGLVFMGEDCDGLVVAFLSAIESVGIEGCIVAHSYEAHRQHTHVLAAVRDEKRNVWVRCDPSTNDPFGTASKPTRETFIAVPGGKVLADKNGVVDAAKVGSGLGTGQNTGRFVGVGRPSDGLLGAGAEPGTTGITEAFYDYMREQTKRITSELADSFYDVKFQHRQYKLACEMMGYPIVSDSWKIESEEYYQDMEKWIPKMISYGYEGSTDKRPMAYDVDNSSSLILGKPGEPRIGFDDKTGRFTVEDTTPSASGTVGAALYIGLAVGAIIVGSVIQYMSVKEVCDIVKAHLDKAAMKRAQDFVTEQTDKLVSGGMSREDAMKEALRIQSELSNQAKDQAEIEVRKEEVSPFSKLAKTAESALTALMVIAMGGVAVYGIAALLDWNKSRRAGG